MIYLRVKYFLIFIVKKQINSQKKKSIQSLQEEKDEADSPKVKKSPSPKNIEKSVLNLDMTRKLATMMDFSVILNKKQGDETHIDFGLNKTGMGNMANEIWDISCIGKN